MTVKRYFLVFNWYRERKDIKLVDKIAITIDHIQTFVTGKFGQVSVEISVPRNYSHLLRIRLTDLIMQVLRRSKKASSRLDYR